MHLYFRILSLLRPNWIKVVVVLVLLITASFTRSLVTQIVGVVVNAATSASYPCTDLGSTPIASTTIWLSRTTGAISLPEVILVIAALYLILGILTRGSSAVSLYLGLDVGRRSVIRLRERLYKHIIHSNMKFHDRLSRADLLSRVVSDTRAIEAVVLGPMVTILETSTTAVWAIVFCLAIEPQLVLPVLIAAPILAITSLITGRVMRKRSGLVRRKLATLMRQVQESFRSIRTVKGLSIEEQMQKAHRETNKGLLNSSMSSARAGYFFSLPAAVVTSLLAAVVLIWGMRLVSGNVLALGDLIIVMSYLPAMFGPLTRIGSTNVLIQQSLAAADRVFEILDNDCREQINQKQLNSVNSSVVFDGHVEFRNVTFSYDNTMVLKDVSFTIESGERVAIVGPSAVGKSTVSALMCGLYSPSKGQVLLSGHDLKELPLHDVRSSIVVVLGDEFLFGVSMKDALVVGRDFNSERIGWASRVCQAEQIIDSLPEGLESQLTDSLGGFSLGQRQRLILMRAIMSAPRILVLDEATTGLDGDTEVSLYRELTQSLLESTIVVIAHRLLTIRSATRILVLANGRIVGDGVHKELVDLCAAYREVVAKQVN
jgi:ABC-type multidrug transport system fused ATPase/permease subunit